MLYLKWPGLMVVGGIFMLFLLSPVTADVVQLKNGEEYNGKVTDLGKEVRVELIYGTITLNKSRIAQIIPQKTIPELYEEQLKAIKADDAEAHYKLALWCRKNRWSSKANEELETVINLNPDHEGARRLMGFHKFNGEWLTEEEYMLARGFVKYEGKWVPRELAVELVKLEGTREALKSRTKEQQERRELFERTERFAVASALTAQQIPQYGRPQKRGGEFEFDYKYEDGSAFSVKASAHSEELLPQVNNYQYNPQYLTTIENSRTNTTRERNINNTDVTNATTNSNDGTRFLRNRQNSEPPPVVTAPPNSGTNPGTTQNSSPPATTSPTQSNTTQTTESKVQNDNDQSDKKNNQGQSKDKSNNGQNDTGKTTAPAVKDDNGHGNDPGHYDPSNPGKSDPADKGKNGTGNDNSQSDVKNGQGQSNSNNGQGDTKSNNGQSDTKSNNGKK